MQIKITRWSDDGIIITGEYETVRAAVVDGMKRGFSYAYSDLTGADLRDSDLRGADLRGAKLGGADLTGANLRDSDLGGSDLRDSDLRGSDLGGANLGGADLTGANIRGVDLRGAKLTGANGLSPHTLSPLYTLLRDQPGHIRAYKLVGLDGEGPHKGGIVYEVGRIYSVADYDEDEIHNCGAGINLATMDWCLRKWQIGCRILVAEFTAKDIVAIPYVTDGKFRVRRCKIVAEKDLSEFGIA